MRWRRPPARRCFCAPATGLTPTDAALTLAPFAEEIAASAAAFLRTAASARGPMAGRVRISASEVMAIEVIPAILAQLAEQHPQLVLELSVSTWSKICCAMRRMWPCGW